MNEEKLLDIRAQLEEELTWRRDEIRLLHNQLGYVLEDDQKRFRKALIVMLYSHFEGFCSTAFQIYIKAINEEALKRKQLNNNLAANSFADVFKAYENPHLKTKEYRKIFKNDPPEEKAIEKFSRQIYFVENLNQFW
ncbi:MAE_28990/MAE_18760 family HEPN-like nuclease [Pseudogracilibacillus sp. SO30301A]|uniref:MAE_28990/MAE_18760 family HEPN-like nuclease n=1 Tax=Pseudogracilibacillus sp. SO30301A TaxID=3098291 RepID=UPI00300E1DB1